MSAECFCGCGMRVPLGRRRVINRLARGVDENIAVLRGAIEHGPEDGPDRARLEQLVAEGDHARAILRRRVHGEITRREMDRDRVKRFIHESWDVRKELAHGEDFVGWNMLGASELFTTGAHAQGEIVAVEDTGTTINEDPRVRVRIRVTPEGEEPFEVERKLTVSRLEIPRRGERVEVAYDPADPTERLTFRIPDLTDDDRKAGEGDDPGSTIDELERLAHLRDSGALTDEEFAAAKARVLRHAA